MAFHVDIIKRDLLASGEHCLARAVLDGGTVRIEADNHVYWRDTLSKATALDPDNDPQGFFEALPSAVDGTYVYATQPHEDDECPLTHPATGA